MLSLQWLYVARVADVRVS